MQFKDALLRLQVTPNVIYADGVTKIRMKILVENNEPDFTRSISGNPPIFKRRTETEVVVQEGEKLVIGGVMLENASKTIRSVPVLSRIPILGWLFKSRELNSDGEELMVIADAFGGLLRPDGGEVARCTKPSSASRTRPSSSRPILGSCSAPRAITRSSAPSSTGSPARRA